MVKDDLIIFLNAVQRYFIVGLVASRKIIPNEWASLCETKINFLDKNGVTQESLDLNSLKKFFSDENKCNKLLLNINYC